MTFTMTKLMLLIATAAAVVAELSKPLSIKSYSLGVPCDGPNFQCNATNGHITNIHDVTFTGNLTANSTVTLSFFAQFDGLFPVTAGTTHFKIWEGRVPTFRRNGGVDYFVCDNFHCDRSKGISLFIDDPSNSTSTLQVKVSFTLPEAIASGIYTTDIYGSDEEHEPYDFVINLAYNVEN